MFSGRSRAEMSVMCASLCTLVHRVSANPLWIGVTKCVFSGRSKAELIFAMRARLENCVCALAHRISAYP